jgi:hypothetical protein
MATIIFMIIRSGATMRGLKTGARLSLDGGAASRDFAFRRHRHNAGLEHRWDVRIGPEAHVRPAASSEPTVPSRVYFRTATIRRERCKRATNRWKPPWRFVSVRCHEAARIRPVIDALDVQQVVAILSAPRRRGLSPRPGRRSWQLSWGHLGLRLLSDGTTWQHQRSRPTEA